MTNDQRRRLEDAITMYGSAKSLMGGAETKATREMARKAVTRAWDLISAEIDALEDDEPVTFFPPELGND